MNALSEALSGLASYAPYILIGLAVVVLLLVLLLVVLAFRARGRARKKAQQDAAQAAAPPVAQDGEPAPQDGVPAGALGEEPEPRRRVIFTGLRAPIGLRRSFARAIRLLRHNVAGRDYRYQTPWFLLFGQQGSGKSSLLRHSGINLPLGRPEADARQRAAACNWWFYDNGVVLDVDGRYAMAATGEGSDERGWYGLLRLLQWYRPRRPIDGVILTISATDLVGPEALPRHRLEANATALYHKLWEAQKRLGLRLPIYVVITKCDVIEGFGALAGALPARLQGQIFGWSSPYTLGAAYSPQWLDDAGAAIDSSMLQLEADVLAQGRRAEDPDKILMLHSHFGEIAGPLRTYVDELFKETAYHEAFLLRGLYFTGDTANPEDRANVVAGPESWEARGADPTLSGQGEPAPVFVRDLLEQKIFPEHGLARPTSRRLAHRSRVVRIAQTAVAATAILGAVGLAFAYNDLSDNADLMNDFVHETFEDLQNLERQRRDVEARQKEIFDTIAALRDSGVTADELPRPPRLEVAKEFFTKSSERLQKGTADFADRDLASWLVPTSWFSSLDEDMRRTLELAYGRIILPSIVAQLEQKAADLVHSPPSAPVTFDGDAPVLFAMETPEFKDLDDFVRRSNELETNVQYYEGLKYGDTVEHIDDLALYSFGNALSQVFEDKAHEFDVNQPGDHFLSFDDTSYKREARLKLQQLNRRAGERLFDGNHLHDLMRELANDLEALRQLQGRVSRDALDRSTLDQQVAALQILHAKIRRTRALLTRPELDWLSQPNFNPGPEYAQLMTRIGSSEFLGPGVRKQIIEENEKRFKDLKTAITVLGSPMTGPLLAEDNGQLRLSPSVLAIEKALGSFLGQSFLSGDTTGDFAKSIPGGRRLSWDSKQLEEALRVGESFDLFLNFEVKAYPASLQNGLAAIAFARLGQHMSSLIGRAQVFSRVETVGAGGLGEQRLAADVGHFEGTAELVLRLHDALDRLQLTRLSGDFRRLVVEQTLSLLRSVDRLLDADGLYLPQTQFADWSGNEPINFQLYGTNDRTELGAYLALQRSRLEFLAYDLARPLVDFMSERRYQTVAGDVSLLFRWQRLLLQLDGYQTARAGNSVAVLEDFILNDLGTVRGDNCLNILAASQEKSGDFFLQRRRDVSRQVLSRCSGLTSQVVRRQYRKLESEFNQQMAGRFPFVEGRPKSTVPDASITEVRSFFKLYDQTVGAETMFQEKVAELFGKDAPVTEFLARLAAVRAFFAPWLDQAENKGGPYYDYEVFFRVAREGENGGNQIIDWRFRTGGTEVSLYDDNRKGRWNAGEPVTLGLRWATGSAFAPVQDGRRDDVEVSGQLARFTYQGNWSLLRLLAANRLQDNAFRTGGDVDPHTLSLEVPLRPTGPPQKGDSGVIKPAQVFVRLRLSLPPEAKAEGAPERLRMPVFPERAPELVLAANESGPKR